jgi:hypothetical protein
MERKNDILRASEIGQYMYCSHGWYLQRCGYEPVSPSLEKGKQLHRELGEVLDSVSTASRASWWYAGIGALLLLILGIVLLEVIL